MEFLLPMRISTMCKYVIKGACRHSQSRNTPNAFDDFYHYLRDKIHQLERELEKELIQKHSEYRDARALHNANVKTLKDLDSRFKIVDLANTYQHSQNVDKGMKDARKEYFGQALEVIKSMDALETVQTRIYNNEYAATFKGYIF